MITLPSNIQRQRKNVKLCMVGIQKQNVNIKNFNKNKSLPCLHCSNKFPWDKTRIDKCLVPFLSTLSWFYWPSYALLQIVLGNFDRHMF